MNITDRLINELDYEDLSVFFTREQVIKYEAKWQAIYSRFRAEVEGLLDEIGDREHAIIGNRDPKGSIDMCLTLL